MKEVKIRLDDNQVQQLDQLAQLNNTTRSDIIRSRLFHQGYDNDSLRRVALAIRVRLNGILSVKQAEHAAAVAVCTLSSTTSNDSSNPKAPSTT